MLHLSSERLAAFADDEPTAAEALHLASCAQCAAERRAHQEVLSLSRTEAARAEAPLVSWESLSGSLAAEGLIRSPGRSSSRVFRRISLLAAGLTLLVGGAAAGRMSAGAPAVPQFARNAERLPEAVGDEAEGFGSSAEALSVLLRSQQDFQRASSYLAAREGDQGLSPSSVMTRLAALEEIYSASASALSQLPSDPMLNSYYMSALGAREATRRQLTQVVPVGLRVRGY